MKNLPVGMDDFSQIIKNDCYYIDKTGLIKEVLTNGAAVTLFTRPRRFGKSLNMSMLQNFFQMGADPTLFENLAITKETKLCEKYLGKYPVILITLKGVEGNSYEEAYGKLALLLNREISNFQFLLDSERLTKYDKEIYQRLLEPNMDQAFLTSSLYLLSSLLKKHYNENVIILIDEYDVPLDKAYKYHYYDRMILTMRSLLGDALKTNPNLKFAILTGCLRISKESIFTGLNNLKVYSITDTQFDEYFGFTEKEVLELLEYYGMQDLEDTVKCWYDGFHFGNQDVYCPWDVINYCNDYLKSAEKMPQNYWINTSGNDIVNTFIDCSKDPKAKTELEYLVNGGSIQKKINQIITYDELYTTSDNLWNTMFMTGYLTQREQTDRSMYSLVIPNLEIKSIIVDKILARFQDDIAKDGSLLNDFCKALEDGDSNAVEKLFTEYMQKTISVRDTFVKKVYKENFYHGMLLGILAYKYNWIVLSNTESGDGFRDILIDITDSDRGIILEVKYSDAKEQMEADCLTALKQIDERRYTDKLKKEGKTTILKYGLACNRKICKVMCKTEEN